MVRSGPHSASIFVTPLRALGPCQHLLPYSDGTYVLSHFHLVLEIRTVCVAEGGKNSGSNVMPFEFAFFLGSTTRSPVFWCAMILGLMYPVYGVQGALTTGEIAALEQLYHNFPGLATAHRRIIEFPQDDYFGKAWTTNFTSYCDHGEGYGFNGIYCHDGHVSGITAYVDG